MTINVTPVIHGGPPPGTGMYLMDTPVIDPAVTLAEYCHIMKINENGFWGVNDPDPAVGSDTCLIFDLDQRNQLLHYLEEAQEEIEQVTNYPLRARWIEETLYYECPKIASMCRVLEVGARLETIVEADSPLEYVSTPGYGTVVVSTAAYAKADLRLYYPVSLVPDLQPEIDVAYIEIDTGAGTTTFYIPRCRLVHPAYVDYDLPIPYNNNAYFLDILDVKAITTDPSSQGTLVWPHKCSGSCNCGCSEQTQTACLYITNSKIGAITAKPATYSSGTWHTATACLCETPSKVTLRYKAGMLRGSTKTKQAMIAVIRLAHSKMPFAPCSCQYATTWWTKDIAIPDVLTRERLNCNFGLSNGAWQAYRWAQSMRCLRGGTL